MKTVTVRYGIGYGTHTDALELEDSATDKEIEEEVTNFVMERVDFGWEVENSSES